MNICVYPQRSALGTSQKSSRNDYMKSGLYSTFTIQSLQVSPSSQPVKTELLLQADPIPKVTRLPKEVGVDVCSRRLPLSSCFPLSSWCCSHLLQVCVLAEPKPPPPAGGGADSSLQVIVNQPSPCRTPALSPQVPASTANQSQVRIHFIFTSTASIKSKRSTLSQDAFQKSDTCGWMQRERGGERCTQKRNYTGNVFMTSSLSWRWGGGVCSHEPARGQKPGEPHVSGPRQPWPLAAEK